MGGVLILECILEIIPNKTDSANVKIMSVEAHVFYLRSIVVYLESRADSEVVEMSACGSDMCRFPTDLFIDGNDQPPTAGYMMLDCTLRDSTDNIDLLNSTFSGKTLYVSAFS